MEMTDDEILRLYKNSRNPNKQIRVLAELNACTSHEIRKILSKYGVLVKKDKDVKNSLRKADIDVLKNPNKFYDFLKAEMDLRPDVSIEEISREAKISRSCVSKYLLNQDLPSTANFEKLLKYLGKTREDYLNYEY